MASCDRNEAPRCCTREGIDSGTSTWIAPIPALDVVVRPDGLPWFRDKSHRLTRAEVERWLSPGVTDVVIGTGWQGRMQS